MLSLIKKSDESCIHSISPDWKCTAPPLVLSVRWCLFLHCVNYELDVSSPIMTKLFSLHVFISTMFHNVKVIMIFIVMYRGEWYIFSVWSINLIILVVSRFNVMAGLSQSFLWPWIVRVCLRKLEKPFSCSWKSIVGQSHVVKTAAGAVCSETCPPNSVCLMIAASTCLSPSVSLSTTHTKPCTCR